MWRADKSKTIKIRLQSNGRDVETVWAEDRGPAPGGVGTRRVRLGNIPFLHAKPTYGDVVEVTPDESDGVLTWDRGGVPIEEIQDRIVEDHGRWVMIVEYALRDPTADVQAAFNVLDIAAAQADIAVEGCCAPTAISPGRAYLAIPDELTVEAVLAVLRKQDLPISLTVVCPREDE